jgi:Kdo2-lipid IVA lauroyltransferase/acyltransferase
MQAFVFYIFLSLNWIMTLLPLGILYIFSDLLFFIFYHFPGYRKDVVETNLRNAFPFKTDSERAEIQRKFYRHLADLFIETLKFVHMSKRERIKRCTYENTELLDRLYSEGKDIAGILGHYNNWEYLNIMPLFTKYTCISIYRPLKNKYFDRFLSMVRSRHGMVLAPTSTVVREIVNRRKKGEKTFTVFLADQTPAKDDIHYWTSFLNQDTPVYLGAEKIAAKYNMAVVFINQQKIKRGYYNIKFELLFDNTSGLRENQVTESHVRHLESKIKDRPEFWIWSHRRWKHKRINPDV